jgi:hypothetical protein
MDENVIEELLQGLEQITDQTSVRGLFDGARMIEGPELLEENGDEQRRQDEVLTELLDRFLYAKSARDPFDERATENFKLYIGHREPVDTGRSNLHIPRAYEQIDTLRSRLVKSFVSQRPYIDFIPLVKPGVTTGDIEDNEQKAAIAAALVDLQLDRNQYPAKLYDFVTQFLIFPAGVLGVGWKYDEKVVRRKHKRKEPIIDPFTGMMMPDPANPMQPLMQEIVEIIEQPEVAWDDNELSVIDYYDFWPDPRGHNVDSCRFVFHRDWMTREQIEEKLMVMERAGNGTVYPVKWDEVRGKGEGMEEGRWERMSAIGLTPETSQGNWDDDDGEQQRPGELYEVLNYWEDTRYAFLINRSTVAYDGPNPYWRHSKKPFVAESFEPLPNQFYGMAAMQLIESLQHEINTHRNQRIDNVSLVLNRMVKVRRGADIDESELVSRPHGVIYVDNMDDVTEFGFSDITGSAYTEEQIAKTDMENTLGVPSVVRGADPVRRETATEVVTKSSNAGLRFDVKIMLFETLGIKRMAMLMDLNNQQFIEQPRLIRLVGEEGANQWQEVTDDQIVGEFDYRPSGANVDPAANKEVRRDQLSNLIMFAERSQNPYIDRYHLTKTWLESFDLRSIDKILLTEEKVQQKQYEAMVMQMKAQIEAQQMVMQEQQQAQMQGEQGQPMPGGDPAAEQQMQAMQAMQQMQQMQGGP